MSLLVVSVAPQQATVGLGTVYWPKRNEVALAVAPETGAPRPTPLWLGCSIGVW